MKKLRTKILLVLAFLSVIIISLGVLGSGFIRELARDSHNITKDNYLSIQYAVNMQRSLDLINSLNERMKDAGADRREFNERLAALKENLMENLDAESNNITEAGEGKAVGNLQTDLKAFLELSGSRGGDYVQTRAKYTEISEILHGIYQLNKDAILRKNLRAENTARRVSMYMMSVGLFSFLVSLVSILAFPGYLVRPIYQMTQKINEIANRNYDQQLSIDSKDEIGDLARAFNTMAVRLKEYERNNLHEMLIEKRRVETILENMTDALLLLDGNKRIVSVNKAALDLFGLKREDVAGKYAPDVATNNDLVREMIKDIMLVEHDINNVSEPLKIIIDNKECYFSREIIEINVPDDRGQVSSPVGHVLVLKNITHFEERDTAKTNLIATVSHELKTPISSINLSLKLLENHRIGNINAEQTKVISGIKQQTLRLSKMVNELLDFSQAESGNIKLNIRSVEPEDIIDYAVTALVMIASEKSIQIDTQIESGLPLIQADTEKTVWVLVNLLSNAIRYSPENSIVKIECRATGNAVVFSVKDSGAGIEKEDYEKIFNKFVQITNNPKGRGLGLTISKEFVVAQGGSIWVESELGVGSTFFFTMPLTIQA